MSEEYDIERLVAEYPELAKYFKISEDSIELANLDISEAESIKPLYTHWSEAASRLISICEKSKHADFF